MAKFPIELMARFSLQPFNSSMQAVIKKEKYKLYPVKAHDRAQGKDPIAQAAMRDAIISSSKISSPQSGKPVL